MLSRFLKLIKGRRFVRILCLSAFTLFFTGCVVSWLVAGALIAPAPSPIGDPPSDLNAKPISFDSDSGAKIKGWHVQADKSKGIVVLVHGIRGNRSEMVDRSRMLRDLGYSSVLIDLQAHGESSGDYIALGYMEKHDVRAAVEFARREHPGEPIGVLGISLGGASALYASPLDIDALILESVYPDITVAIRNRVNARLGPLASLPTAVLVWQLRPRLGIAPKDLRPIDCITRSGCPVFVVSGTHDIYRTWQETEELFSVAKEPKQLWLVEGGAHVDLLAFSPVEYRKRIGSFFAEHLDKDDAKKVVRP